MSIYCTDRETKTVRLGHIIRKSQRLAWNLSLLTHDRLPILSRTLRNGWGLQGQGEKAAEVLHALRTLQPQGAVLIVE